MSLRKVALFLVTPAVAVAVHAASPLAASAVAESNACESAYPTVCIPSGPDLDCGDISERNFTVQSPDPHRFDNDGDGVGCES